MSPDPIAYVDEQAVSIRDMADLVAKVEAALLDGEGFTLFTLNLDHLVKRRQDPLFRRIYSRATLVAADGWPVVSLVRRQAPALERTTGADAVLPLCRLAVQRGESVALFGSSQAILDEAADRLRGMCPGLEVAFREAPPYGFDPMGDAGEASIARLRTSGAKICFVALGAPKQEAFADRALSVCPTIGLVCVGAALDFVAGAQKRAPRFLQAVGLEWAWRVCLEPIRLGRRYLSCAWLFAKLWLDTKKSPVRDGLPS